MVVWQALLIGVLASCMLVGALVALGARLGEAEDAAVRGRRIGDKR